MNGFTLLWAKILRSSLWTRESKETRLVWIAMLALKDRNGVVEGSVEWLASAARVSLDECAEAIKVLESPDSGDTSGVDEGRRIKPVRGGWQIVNHDHYRFATDTKREFWRQYQQEYRLRKSKTEPQARFKKPTLEELTASGLDQNNAERFLNYYESKGWKVGKSPMKDWQAAVRNWMKNNSPKPTPSKPLSYEEILKESQK